jgi:hypothetical protein
MATAPILPDPDSSDPTRITVRVGAAFWTVSLSNAAAASLRARHSSSQPGEAALDLDRTMESMRRKAVGLRMFGGGSIRLDATDVAPPIEPHTDEEGHAIVRAPWYAVIETAADALD